jgi:arylsulfatase A-like enzyme
LHGHSLKAQLQNASSNWPYAAVTTWENGSSAIRTRDFRYILYGDGSEELYDHRNDPHEWHNLAPQMKFAATRNQLKQHLLQELKRLAG